MVNITDSKKYRVGYVDEDQTDINDFYRFFDRFFDIVVLKPDMNTKLEDIISWKNENELDILIVDFNLKEADSVNMYGNQILEAISNKYLNFPMFMFTGYAVDAVDESDPSIDDLIYEKDYVFKNSELIVKRITNKIKNYKTKLEDAHKKYHLLVKKEILTIEEEEELLKLDMFLEESYDKDQSKPLLLKYTKYLQEISTLIEKADDLLREIDEND